MTSKVIYKISKKNVTWKDNPISPAVVIVVWSQFVDNLFIVRLRLNMLMRRAVIINYFLVQKVELKIYYYRLLKFCLGLPKSPWHNLCQKHRINN